MKCIHMNIYIYDCATRCFQQEKSNNERSIARKLPTTLIRGERGPAINNRGR